MTKWLLPLLVFWSTSTAASVVDRVAAVVDDHVITRSEVEEYRAFQRNIGEGGSVDPEGALEQLIENVLIRQEAQDRGQLPTEEELNSALADIRARNGVDEEQFRQILHNQGVEYGAYVQRVTDQLVRVRVVGRVLRDRLAVDDESLREYYLKNVAEYCESPSLHLLHIQVPEEQGREQAEELRSRLDAGEEATEAVGEDQLNDMGYVPVDNLAADIRATLGDLPEGSVSPVVEMGGACNLFYVMDRKEGRVRPFEEVRDLIRERYFQDREKELFRVWLDDRKARAHIVRKPAS